MKKLVLSLALGSTLMFANGMNGVENGNVNGNGNQFGIYKQYQGEIIEETSSTFLEDVMRLLR